MLPQSSLKYFSTLVIGGGPAGTGLLMKAIKDGKLDQLLDKGFALVERGPYLIKGSLADYKINSDTLSDVFLECLEGCTEEILDISSLQEDIQEIRKYKGKAIPLNFLATYFIKLGELLANMLDANKHSQIFLNTRVSKIIQEVSGTFQVFFDSGEFVRAENVVLANGGRAEIPQMLNIGVPIALNNYAEKIILSDRLLKGMEDGRLAHLRPSSRVLIVGGSHSAFSSAVYLLEKNNFEEDAISIYCENKPKIFFATKEEAENLSYIEFTADDICPVTQRIYRLAGLRMDGRTLYMRMLGLGAVDIERRVSLKLPSNRQTSIEDVLLQADIIVAACGYTFSIPPVYRNDGSRVFFRGQSTGHWVDQECRVLENSGEILPGLFATGLATGFIPSGKLGGEASFTGQTNGLWYYQNALAEVILQQLQYENTSALS